MKMHIAGSCYNLGDDIDVSNIEDWKAIVHMLKEECTLMENLIIFLDEGKADVFGAHSKKLDPKDVILELRDKIVENLHTIQFISNKLVEVLV